MEAIPVQSLVADTFESHNNTFYLNKLSESHHYAKLYPNMMVENQINHRNRHREGKKRRKKRYQNPHSSDNDIKVAVTRTNGSVDINDNVECIEGTHLMSLTAPVIIKDLSPLQSSDPSIRNIEDLLKVALDDDDDIQTTPQDIDMHAPLPRVRQMRRLAKSDEGVLKRIEKYISSCDNNYEDIKTKINSTFAAWSASLNYRRRALIEEAKNVRDQKVKSLNELKSALQNNQEQRSTLPGDLAEKDDTCKNIMPKKMYELPKELQDFRQEGKENMDSKNIFYVGMNSQQDMQTGYNGFQNGVNQDICAQDFTSSIVLQEGNMTFNYQENDSMFLSKLGTIKEDLSSSQRSFSVGFEGSKGIVGVNVPFEIHTCTISGESNWNSADKVAIRIYDCDNNKVNTESSSKNTRNGIYGYSFVPLKPGLHEVVVKLNDIQLFDSPYKFNVFPKLNATFQLTSNFIESSKDMKEFEDTEGNKEEANLYTLENYDHDKPRMIQKNLKSVLLRSSSDAPSQFYAVEDVKDVCAWQMRVTVACRNIYLSIGIKSRCGIADIENQFTCDFNLEEITDQTFAIDTLITKRPSLRRQISSFPRLSLIFTVFIENDKLHVVCPQLNREQTIKVEQQESFTLHPFCSITHYHKVDSTNVCPRPQISFL